MRIFLRHPEAVSMLLRQQIEAGWAKPSARSALAKIQGSKSGGVDLYPEEIEAVLDVFGDLLGDYYWTPITGQKSPTFTISPHRREVGPTRYQTRRELESVELTE